MKKKVIIAIPYLSGKGGTETVIKNFHQAISAYGNNDYIWKLISYGGTKYPSWMQEWNKKVYNFTNSRCIQKLFYCFLLPFLIGIDLKKENPNYFIATNPIIWTLAFYQRKIFSPKTKIISWYHFSFKRKNINKRYLKTVDLFWAISSEIKNELISMGIDENKISLIYNPISFDNINDVRRSGLQNKFIYIGRIDYSGQKNVSELMQAFNKVKGNWTLDLYGNVDKKDKAKLLNIITTDKKSRIKFHGFHKKVWNQIKVADSIVLTSKYEGLPMVLCEAAARGIAIISSNCSGVGDIVVNNGWIYRQNDISQLVNILNNVVEKTIQLPNKSVVRKSINKFTYKCYLKRIYMSLDKI